MNLFRKKGCATLSVVKNAVGKPSSENNHISIDATGLTPSLIQLAHRNRIAESPHPKNLPVIITGTSVDNFSSLLLALGICGQHKV